MSEKKKAIYSVFIMIGLLFFLSSCSDKTANIQTTTPVQYFEVSFLSDDVPVCTVRVEDGMYAQAPDVMKPGYYLDHWADLDGNEIDPNTTPIHQAMGFEAIYNPLFLQDAAFLFPDADDRLCPDDSLTYAQLETALKELSSKQAGEIIKSLIFFSPNNVQEPVEKDQLIKLYQDQRLFPEEYAQEAMLCLSEGEVSRRSFARSIEILLQRDWENTPVSILPDVKIPKDIDPASDEAGLLLDACLPHCCGSGKPITEAALEMAWEPGFHLQNGFLYYADENGRLLRNGDVGNYLHFDASGRYTSGDPELDDITAQLIRDFQQQGQVTDRYDLLYSAFTHVRDNMVYIRREKLKFRETDWANRLGKEALTTYKGNCFHYAAAFTVLARALGYDAREISGQGFEPLMPHGWVEIYIDGEQLFFDPQTAAKEVVYHARPNWGEDMFAVPMYKKDWWRYTW